MNNSNDAAATGILALLGSGMFLVFFLVIYVVFAVALMTLANKLSIQNSWLAWVPIGNLYLMTQCAGLDWWWLLLCLVPYVGVVAAIYVWWKITEARGKQGPMALLMLVPCVGMFYPLWLAFVD